MPTRIAGTNTSSPPTSSCCGAGTLGSTEILLRSQAEGLALSDWLGSRFTSNGDAIALAYNNDVPVNGVGVGQPPKAQVPPVGQAVNALIDLRDTKDVRDGLAMCECALPSAFASAAAGAAGARRGASSASTRSARSAISSRPWSAPPTA